MQEVAKRYERSKDLIKQLDLLPQLRGYNLLSPDRQQIKRLSLYLNERAKRLFREDALDARGFFKVIERYGVSAMLWNDYNCHWAAATLLSAIGPKVNIQIYPPRLYEEIEVKSPETDLSQIPEIVDYCSFDSIEDFFSFVNNNIPCVVRENINEPQEHSFVVLDYIKIDDTVGYAVWENFGIGINPFQIRFIPKDHFEKLKEVPIATKIPTN